MNHLDGVIEYLERLDQDLVLRDGWRDPHSYRGRYIEVAFEPQPNVTVADCLAACREARGSTYTGWKGGDYTMYGHTGCYIAVEGDTGFELSTAWLALNVELSTMRAVRVDTTRLS